MLDVMLQTPQDSPAGVVASLNQKLRHLGSLSFTPAGAPVPPSDADQLTLSQTVAGVDGTELGSLHLTVPAAGTDEPVARSFGLRVARLLEKVNALQDRHNRLQKLAITDELTGLYNGRYFRHFLTRMVDKARHLRFPVTLLLFDIDNFKKYNDTYGHGVGDEILRQTASLMRRCVRDHDLVARISGDEFAVVFWEKEGPRQPRDPSTGGVIGRPPQTPVQLLERFRRLLSNQNFTGLGPAGQGTLTISGGLAVYPWDAENAPDLIEAADRALMFKAKQSGKNSIYLVGGKCTTDADSPE